MVDFPHPPPSSEDWQPQTRQLHDAIDANITQGGVPYLHPRGPSLSTDLLGSATMRAWQDAKAQAAMLGEQSWSSLPPIYSRYGTQAGNLLAARIAQLEGAPDAILTDSGMQAVCLVVDALATPGCHILVSRQLYNKSKTYVTWLSSRMNFDIGILDDAEETTLREKVTPKTTVVLVETFSNPLVRAIDPVRFGATIAGLREDRAPNLRGIIDNTIATPWGPTQPLLSHEGIDAVVAAGTKAVGGQDQTMWGYVTSRRIGLLNIVKDLQAMRGGVMSWRDCEAVRTDLDNAQRWHAQRCTHAEAVATFLDDHPQVETVHHPSLRSHPDHPVVTEHYQRTGSLLSFRLSECSEEEAGHFSDVLALTRVFRYALSFDGLVSKVNHHQGVSEFHTPPGVLRKQGIDRLIRLGIGTEDPADLTAALAWALEHHRAISTQQITQAQQDRRRELGLAFP